MGISVFRGGHEFFFRVTLKAFISIRMTLATTQNNYFDYMRHVWDIFGTISPLKTIFWDYIFENFRLKMNKNTFFGLLWLYKGNYYLFKLRNEEFRWDCLRSEYMTIIISLFFSYLHWLVSALNFFENSQPSMSSVSKPWRAMIL